MHADTLPVEQAPRVNGAAFPNPHGLPLFPLQANSKRPRPGDNAFWRRASPDPASIPEGCNAGVATGAGLIVVDVDMKGGKNGLATLAGLEAMHDALPATYTVATPSGGQHRYFRDPSGRDFGQGADRLGPGVDVKADPHGYVVAPGSAVDGHRYEIASDVPIADAPAWLVERLAESAPRARGQADQVPLVELDAAENVRLAVDWLVNEAPEAIEGAGGDGTTAKVIAPKLKDFGLSPEMAVELALEHWNPTKAIPPWEPDELEKKIRSGYRSATAHPPGIEIARQAHHEFEPLPPEEVARIEGQRGPERPEAADASDSPAYALIPWGKLVGEPPPMEWIWEGMIPRGHVTVLFGDGGVGKSLLAQQLATVIAMPAERRGLGHDGLFGRRVEPGRVLALFCEDDENELWRRQERINATLGLARRDLHAFGTISGHGQENFLVTFERPAGQEQAPLTRLREISREFRPSLVIIDNIADTFGGNEITRTQVNRFLKKYLGKFAREQDCAVLLLGHPSVAGQNSGTGLSGSTAWNNGVRSRLYMRRVGSDDPNPDPEARILEKMKANYGVAGEWMRLRYNEGTFDCVLEQSGSPTPADATKHQETVLKVMGQLIGHGVNLSPNSRAGNCAVKELRKSDEIAAMRLEKRQLERIVTALLTENEIHIEAYRNRGCEAQRYQIGARPNG